MRDQDLARIWRRNNGYVGKGGVVVLKGSVVGGWVNMLRDPGDWEPGCIAIEEDGTTYVSKGGNYRDGAKIWRKI